MTATTRPGEWVHSATGLADIGPDAFNARIATDRYTSRDYQDREREAIWLRVWQAAGRVDELPKVGDWKECRIFDQSFVIVRGKDGELPRLRQCLQAPRKCAVHRRDRERETWFPLPVQLWSYDLEGRLRGVLREDLAGQIDKNENSPAPGSRRHLRRFHLH